MLGGGREVLVLGVIFVHFALSLYNANEDGGRDNQVKRTIVRD